MDVPLWKRPWTSGLGGEEDDDIFVRLMFMLDVLSARESCCSIKMVELKCCAAMLWCCNFLSVAGGGSIPSSSI